jgi:hypothetical protein
MKGVVRLKKFNEELGREKAMPLLGADTHLPYGFVGLFESRGEIRQKSTWS